jgi:hypothetical protein
MRCIILYATDCNGKTQAWYFPTRDGQHSDWLMAVLNGKELQINASILMVA